MTGETTPDIRVYHPADRPFVAVLIERTWYLGDLRMWTKKEGTWHGQVSWTKAPSETYISTFPADHIRLVEESQ